jgi:hypothetical protein
MDHTKLEVRENAVSNLIGSSGVQTTLGTAIIRLVFGLVLAKEVVLMRTRVQKLACIYLNNQKIDCSIF